MNKSWNGFATTSIGSSGFLVEIGAMYVYFIVAARAFKADVQWQIQGKQTLGEALKSDTLSLRPVIAYHSNEW